MEGTLARLLGVVAPILVLAAGVPLMLMPAAAQVVPCWAPLATSGGPGAPIGGFHAVTPVRLLDTRPQGKVGGGCVVSVDVSSVAPAGAAGVALNVTTTDAEARGYVTAYPCGSPLPPTSNVNPRVGDPTPNLVVVPIDAGRTVCLFTFAAANMIVDASGWFGTGGELSHEVEPRRIVDTRTNLRPDGGNGTKLAAGSTLSIPMAGTAAPPEATAVAVNLTITEPGGPGYATAYPCGTPPPLSSNVNFLPGENRANQAMVGLGGGALCVFVFAETHLVIDIAGWFGPGDSGVPLQTIPASRLVDSRNGTGGINGPIVAGETKVLDPNVAGTLPVGAHVAVLNVVATQAGAPGYLTVYPCSRGRPETSSVNYAPGNESTNLVSVPLDAAGKICVYSFERTHVVIDLFGSFGAPGQLRLFRVDPPALALDPPFRPDIHDYVLHCAAGSNDIAYTAVGMPGAAVSVDGVASPSGHRTLAENGALVVTAGTDQYFVRCLPHDFPPLTVVKTGAVAPGYYLLENGVAGGLGRFLMILDTNGVPVWYRRVGPAEVDFKLLPDGNLASMPFVRTVFNIDPTLGYNERELDGTLVRTVKAPSLLPTDYHDLVQLPNGNYLVVGYRQRTTVGPSGFPACNGTNKQVVDGVILEVTPAGTLVGTEWSTAKHVAVDEVVVPLCDSAAVTGSSPPTNAVDYAHVNAVDYDAATNQVIVTSRHLNAVLWIDWADPMHKVVRKLGGKGANPDSPAVFTFAGAAANAFALPHDGRMNANGHLTVFDNQAAPVGSGLPRAAEYALDPAAKTATLVWQRPLGHTGSLFGGLGSVRRQPDGNTVIAWGGFNDPAFTEVDPAGNALVQVSLPVANLTYRVTKVPASTFSLDELHATVSG